MKTAIENNQTNKKKKMDAKLFKYEKNSPTTKKKINK